MIEEVSAELLNEGMDLAELNSFKSQAESDLAQAGTLALPARLNLADSAESVNPLATAAKIVLNLVLDRVLASSSLESKGLSIHKKLGLSLMTALGKVKDTKAISNYLKPIHFTGALTKITSEGTKRMTEFGTLGATMEDQIKSFATDLVDTALAGELASKAETVEKIVSGLIIGSTGISVEGFESTSDNNPPAVATDVAMQIYNDNMQTTYSINSKDDFMVMIDMVLDSAVDAMDDTMSDAVDVYVEVAVTVFDISPEDIQAELESIAGYYEEAEVEVPDDLVTYADSTDVIETLEAEGAITTEEADSYDDAINQATTSIDNDLKGITVVDTDGDGIADEDDAFPNDPSETVDADGDGIGANTDFDDLDPYIAEPMITRWNMPAGQTLQFPLRSGTLYDFEIDWGDGTVQSITADSAAHTYTDAGIYTVKIKGSLPALFMKANASSPYLIEVVDLGSTGWTNLSDAFYTATNLTSFAKGKISQVTSLNLSLIHI